MINMEPSLRIKLKKYKKRAAEIENYLSNHPHEWGKFQGELNAEVNMIFRDIMNFEREMLSIGREDKVYKLKQIFIDRIRELFLKGSYNEWSLRKPYGYAGDFKIIDEIYRNSPSTNGFIRLFDNYFQMSAISVSVRNRKEDFKSLISNLIKENSGKRLRIMNLASGPCREIHEILCEGKGMLDNVDVDCYEHDERAIEYAKSLLGSCNNVNFFKENALRIAFRKNIESLIKHKYDLIYSTGLFDYFNERTGVALIKSLKQLMISNGVLAISTMRDRYNNPSVHYMEWVGDWNLVYRDEIEFKRIFGTAGFETEHLEIKYEQQGIMQYIVARNEK